MLNPVLFLGSRKCHIFTLVLILFAGCGIQRSATKQELISHESGIQYRVNSPGKGESIKENDIVWAHYTLFLQDSTKIDDSRERGEPVYFKVGAGQVIPGWDIGMALLKEGDKATLIVPPHLAYGDREVGAIPANSTLYFDVEILKVESPPQAFQIEKDTEIKTTTSGLRYAVVKPGKGTMLVPGMKVRIHYTGYFEDMNQFDSSHERSEPIEFTLGKGMVIRGWEEGISKLRVGDKARLWVPYSLAYGETGRGPIPPASNLIFDVEVIDAQEVKRPAPFDVAAKDTLTTETGLKYIVVKQGTGSLPGEGQIVEVDYTGFLMNGNIFDSSVERGQAFRFVLGRGQVIAGWDEGVSLMRKGAQYRFIVPSVLGYGERAIGPIPANADLIFDVELLDID